MNFLASNKSEQKLSFPKSLTEDKIRSFLNFPKGWHFGHGFPPSDKTVMKALRICNLAQLYSLETDAIPGIDGEIQILCFNANDTLEFTIGKEGKVTFVFEKGIKEISYIEGLSIEKAIDKLFEYGRKICNLSKSSIKITTSNTKKDLAAWRSKIPPTEAEYRLFPCPV